MPLAVLDPSRTDVPHVRHSRDRFLRIPPCEVSRPRRDGSVVESSQSLGSLETNGTVLTVGVDPLASSSSGWLLDMASHRLSARAARVEMNRLRLPLQPPRTSPW